MTDAKKPEELNEDELGSVQGGAGANNLQMKRGRVRSAAEGATDALSAENNDASTAHVTPIDALPVINSLSRPKS